VARANKPPTTSASPISFDKLPHPRISGRTAALVRRIFLALKKAGFSRRRRSSSSSDPVRRFPADRYIKASGPKCRTKDQYGDSVRENCGARPTTLPRT